MAHVAVVGPGAVGATFAAAAERAGHEVVLCARRPGPPPVVELPDGAEHALAGPVRADPATVEPALWVLLAVKTHQVAGAAPWLRALCGSGTVVVALQNGVEHRRLVGPLAGPAAVLPAIVWCPSEVVAPGRVRQREPAQISVPAQPEGDALAALLGDTSVVETNVVGTFTLLHAATAYWKASGARSASGSASSTSRPTRSSARSGRRASSPRRRRTGPTPPTRRARPRRTTWSGPGTTRTACRS